MGLTKVTDSLLMQIESKSENPIYQEERERVLYGFQKLYPNYSGLNILKMRAVLAGDIDVVNKRGNKFFLMLSSERIILDEMNEKIRTTNRYIRAENKMIKRERRQSAISWAEKNLPEVLPLLKE